MVHRILFDGKKAIGVEIEKNGNVENIYSNEVILSGGAINSPQLLMLSGIGNADHLKSLDIPVVAHVPGVGENLQDHLELGVAQKCKKPITLLKEQKFPKMIQIGKYCLYILSACFFHCWTHPPTSALSFFLPHPPTSLTTLHVDGLLIVWYTMYIVLQKVFKKCR